MSGRRGPLDATRRLRLIGQKDAEDAIRDYQIHVIGAAFLLIGLGLGYFAGEAGPQSTTTLTAGVVSILLFLAPTVVLVVSHDAVSGKRVDGELTVLLGLPYARWEVVFGTLLGRFSVVGSTAILGILAATVVGVARGATVSPVALALGTAALLVVTLLFASVAVAVSTASRNATQSSTAAFAVFVLFVFRFWEFVPSVVDGLLNRLVGAGLPQWVGRVFAHTAPFAAVRNAIGPLSDPVLNGFATFTTPLATDGSPLVQQPAVGAVVTLAWLVVPISVACWRFSRADL